RDLPRRLPPLHPLGLDPDLGGENFPREPSPFPGPPEDLRLQLDFHATIAHGRHSPLGRHTPRPCTPGSPPIVPSMPTTTDTVTIRVVILQESRSGPRRRRIRLRSELQLVLLELPRPVHLLFEGEATQLLEC